MRTAAPQDAEVAPYAGVESRPAPFQGEFEAQTGSKTVKRFTADYLDHGQGRNKPRLFNSIRPLQVGPKDLEPLDVHSSLEPVRSAALRRQMEERKKNAMNPRHSALWSEAKGQIDVEAAMKPAETKDRTSIHKPSPQPPRERTASVNTEWVVSDTRREPRSFGSPAPPTKLGSSAVRCGGFQSLDWSTSHAKSSPTLKAPPAKAAKNDMTAKAPPAPSIPG